MNLLWLKIIKYIGYLTCWHNLTCLSHEVNFVFYAVSCRSILFGYNRENSYLTTLPEVFPCINPSTSSTVTWLKSPYMVFFNADAARANSNVFWSLSGRSANHKSCRLQMHLLHPHGLLHGQYRKCRYALMSFRIKYGCQQIVIGSDGTCNSRNIFWHRGACSDTFDRILWKPDKSNGYEVSTALKPTGECRKFLCIRVLHQKWHHYIEQGEHYLWCGFHRNSIIFAEI